MSIYGRSCSMRSAQFRYKITWFFLFLKSFVIFPVKFHTFSLKTLAVQGLREKILKIFSSHLFPISLWVNKAATRTVTKNRLYLRCFSVICQICFISYLFRVSFIHRPNPKFILGFLKYLRKVFQTV